MRILPMSDMPSASGQRWLTIIGIGEDGPAGLGDEAKRLILAGNLRRLLGPILKAKGVRT